MTVRVVTGGQARCDMRFGPLGSGEPDIASTYLRSQSRTASKLRALSGVPDRIVATHPVRAILHGMVRTGILLALLSAALFGASMPIAKLLLASVDPRMMAGMLYLGADSGLAVIHLSRVALRLPAAETPWCRRAFVGSGQFSSDIHRRTSE